MTRSRDASSSPNLAIAHAPNAAHRVLERRGMKKLDKIRLSNKSSRKLALEASTLKLLSCEQLTTAQGGVTQSHGCESAGCY